MLSLTRWREFWIYRQLARGLNAWPTAALVSWTRTQAHPRGHGNHVERRWASKASRGWLHHSSLCLLNTQDPNISSLPSASESSPGTYMLCEQPPGNHMAKRVDDLVWTCAVALRIYHQQSDKWPRWYFMVCPWLAFVSFIGLAGPAVDSVSLWHRKESHPSALLTISTAPTSVCYRLGCTPPGSPAARWERVGTKIHASHFIQGRRKTEANPTVTRKGSTYSDR